MEVNNYLSLVSQEYLKDYYSKELLPKAKFNNHIPINTGFTHYKVKSESAFSGSCNGEHG